MVASGYARRDQPLLFHCSLRHFVSSVLKNRALRLLRALALSQLC